MNGIVIIIDKLEDVFSTIRNPKIFRAALWILGEYCDSRESAQEVMTLMRQSLGELPIVDDEMREAAGERGEIDTTKDTELKAKVSIQKNLFRKICKFLNII
jgi:hypothetical protein